MKRADAIHHFKGIAPLAKALGITYEAVRQWGEEIPELRQYQLELVTDGQLKADKKKTAA
ncbi:Cro/Cl family transcriptional regulator [Pseudomonas veronii]|uniref:Cro/CI family transcriptional regulator n=1 Tax=Pseudomonas veronii TaxID=76761 RepID=UPI00147272CA|nr:Cro/CI family transcriptional regulator [Pseudomonas veronii]NMX37305.1 Cro/Cl family transcriptional regulator [Pseudomonas veronii]DAM66916.1 MAG TPA: DNA-binding transcriptional regulator [Caudoviricetes sp.]